MILCITIPYIAILVKFMIALQGSWEKKLIERVHNVAKTGERSCSDPTASASKSPKDAPLMQQYPPLPCVDDEIDEQE